MKRSSFLEGTFFATMGIILCKVIGALYVIPFYAMIGVQGGALYGYAYSIYAVFISFSIGGIPLAISKLVSEYRTLGYQHTKEKIYQLGVRFAGSIGFILFLILFFIAPFMAKMMLGSATGGNTVSDVTLVIRIISTSLLIVPRLAVSRGYFQGHNFMKESSISSILEQLIRVLVILGGCYLTIQVFHGSIKSAVGISVFGATAGALIGYLYLLRKKHIKLNPYTGPMSSTEKKLTDAYLLRKIILCALPFFMIESAKAAFSLVDTFTLVKTLVRLNFTVIDAELIQSIVTTWGSKLNMIVISISLGITVSIVPYISSSLTKKEMGETNRKIEQSIVLLALFVFPLALGLSFLSTPLWTVFYGKNVLGSTLFQFFVFATITFSFFSLLIHICQTMNQTKLVMRVLIWMFALKLLMNVPSMYLFSYFNISAYFGPLFVTMLIDVIITFYLLLKLQKQGYAIYRIVYYSLKILLCSLIMFMALKIVGSFFFYRGESRIISLFVILAYGLLGTVIYAFLIWKSTILRDFFGITKLHKIKNLFLRKG